MANEFRHADVGAGLTEAEYDSVTGHQFASQATGDIMYATSTSQLSRLGIGSTGAVLTVTGGIPAWDTTWTPTGALIPATDDTYDLGSASAAWQDLFLEGDITFTDAGNITFTPSTDDTVVLTASTNGAFSLVTTDTAAAAANIQITADGTVDIDSAGVLTLDSGAAINIEPASGSAILLDGTISIDAGVVTGATSITSADLTVTNDIGVDGTANLDNTDIDGTLVVDGTNISLDSTATLNIDNSNTSNGITIGTATASVPIAIGHGTGSTVTIGNDLTVTGDLTVSGTTTTVDTTTLAVVDPIIHLQTASDGGALGSDTNKDVGLALQYHTGSAAKQAFLGIDDSDSYKLMFVTDASISSEVVSGSVGTIKANLEGNVTGALTGNASGSAATLATPRAIAVAGDVTGTANFDGSAAISISSTIANNAVSLAKMAGLTRGKIIYGDASGDPAALTVGSSTQVLTSDGTDISWATPTTGDITGVTAGTGLSGGGDSGGVTLNVEASQTQITHVGALQAGSITSGFGTIDTGSSAITTTGAVGTGATTVGGTLDAESYMALGNGSALNASRTLIIDRDFTTAGTAAQLFVTGTGTLGVGHAWNGIQYSSTAAVTVAGSGTHADVHSMQLAGLTVGGSAATISRLSTLYISSPPTYSGTTTEGPFSIFVESGKIYTSDTTGSTSTSSGALVVRGGVGIGENLHVGGDVGIGIAGPDSLLHVYASSAGTVVAHGDSVITAESSGNTAISILAANNKFSRLFFGSPAQAYRAKIEYQGSTGTNPDTFVFNTATADRLFYSAGAFAFQEATTISTTAGNLTLAPDGDVLVSNGSGLVVGHTAQVPAFYGLTQDFQVVGNASNVPGMAIVRFSADTSGGNLNFVKSRDPAVADGTFDIVLDNDQLGIIVASADDGTNNSSQAAAIEFRVDGTPDEDDMPGRIAFLTTPSGSVTSVERLRIDSLGQVKVASSAGSTSTSTGALVVPNGGVGIGEDLYVGEDITLGAADSKTKWHHHTQRANNVTTAADIYTASSYGSMICVMGVTTANSASFMDLVMYRNDGSNFSYVVVQALTLFGSPAARTYSAGANKIIKVAMLSGIYDITTWGIIAPYPVG